MHFYNTSNASTTNTIKCSTSSTRSNKGQVCYLLWFSRKVTLMLPKKDLNITTIYESKVKCFRPSLQPTWNSGQVGPGQELVLLPHYCKAFLVATHGSMDISGSTLVYCHRCLWIHGLRARKLYSSEVMIPASVRVSTQWPLVPSFMSVVG